MSVPDSIRVPERVAVHVIDLRPRHRARVAQRGNQHHHIGSVPLAGFARISLHELQCRQKRFEDLPVSKVCSLSLEDALCGTHLLSQVLSVNLLPQQGQRRPTNTNKT
jgi:hypothetical protein